MEMGVSGAKDLCESGLYERAIKTYGRISEQAPSDGDAIEVARLMEACMRELVRRDDGRERLRGIADESESRTVSAKALLILATDYYWEKEDCSAALPLYRR